MATFKAKPLTIIAFPSLIIGLLLPLLLPLHGCTQTTSAPTSAPATTSAPQNAPTEAAAPPNTVQENVTTRNLPTETAPLAPDATELPTAPEPITETEEAPTETIAQRLAVAGIDNPQSAKDFIAQMNTAAAENDRDAIANLIHYPFTTYNVGEPVKTYTTPTELLADFDQIVTPAVLTAMSQATYDDLFANYQGAMIDHGTVWFTQFDEDLKIHAINS